MLEGWGVALTPGVHSQVLGRRMCIINPQELWTYTLFLKVVSKTTTTTRTLCLATETGTHSANCAVGVRHAAVCGGVYGELGRRGEGE